MPGETAIICVLEVLERFRLKQSVYERKPCDLGAEMWASLEQESSCARLLSKH